MQFRAMRDVRTFLSITREKRKQEEGKEKEIFFGAFANAWHSDKSKIRTIYRCKCDKIQFVTEKSPDKCVKAAWHNLHLHRTIPSLSGERLIINAKMIQYIPQNATSQKCQARNVRFACDRCCVVAFVKTQAIIYAVVILKYFICNFVSDFSISSTQRNIFQHLAY